MEVSVYEKIKKSYKELFPDNKESQLEEIISRTEERLGKELTGYGVLDKPYTQYFEGEISYPQEKIGVLVLKKALENKNKIAYVCGREITFGEFYEKAIEAASALKNMGIKEGDFITMCIPSTPEAIYIFFAACLIGAITRPIDPMSSKNQIKANLLATNSKLLVTLNLNYGKMKDVSDGTNAKVLSLSLNDSLPKGMNIEKVVVELGTLYTNFLFSLPDKCESWIKWQDFIRDGENNKQDLESLEGNYSPQNVISVFSTSGSTGEPRGVCITEENMLGSIYKQLNSKYKITSEDTIFNPMPTCSSYFWDDIILAIIYGVPTTLSPIFNAEKSPKEILRAGCSVTLAGPLILEKLNEYIENKRKKGKYVSLAFLKHMISGGDLLELLLEETTNANFSYCGSTAIVQNALGTSETCGPSMVPNGMMDDESSYCLGSVGVPLPEDVAGIFNYDPDNQVNGVDAVDYDKGLLYYEIGEICFRADNLTVFKEYYKDRDSTEAAKVMHKDGNVWYHTGDLGFMDPGGRLFCSCRKSGLIVRDGHKIWAPKIENVIKQIPGIIDCAVIGVADKKEKEVPVAFIVFDSDVDEPTKVRIQRTINVELSKKLDIQHAVKGITCLDEIPRNLMLKVKIKDLVDIYLNGSNVPEKTAKVLGKIRNTETRKM